MSKILLTILPYIFVFIASFFHPWDLDLGWHLRVGRDIVENHTFPYTNTYSSELAGYNWFNSSWGLDVLKYIVFNNTGFFGLAIFGSLVVLAICFILAKFLNLSLFAKSILFPLFIVLEYSSISQSLRGQVVSLLFLALLYGILWKYQQGKSKVLFILPPFFFLWANLHAQFVLGLAVFILWSITFTLLNIKKGIKKHLFLLTFTILLSFLMTIINPYGINLYQESLNLIGHPAKSYVNEFQPPVYGSANFFKLVIFGILMLISLVIIVKKRLLSKYIPFIIIGTGLYILSFIAKRYIWPMYILTIPQVVLIVRSLEPKNKIVSGFIAVFIILLSLTFVIIAEFPQRSLTKMNWQNYCKFVPCSPMASEVLKAMPRRGKLFTHYNYGGYLIWNYPEIKPSMDGRMSLWLDEKGQNPFRKFITTLFSKRKQIDIGPYDTYFVPTNSFLANELFYLSNQNSKWKKIYSDNVTSIYSRL